MEYSDTRQKLLNNRSRTCSSWVVVSSSGSDSAAAAAAVLDSEEALTLAGAPKYASPVSRGVSGGMCVHTPGQKYLASKCMSE